MEETAAKEFLRLCAATIRSYGLYPEKHPIREDNLSDLWEVTARMVREHGAFDLFVHQDSFFFGDRLLPKESLTLQWMLRAWQRAGIKSISVAADTTREDIVRLIDFLAMGGVMPQGHASVNTAELFDQDRLPSGTLTGIKGAYSSALDTLRETGIGDVRLRARSLEPARRAVDGLVEEVLSDPASAILLSTMRSHDEYTFFHMVNVCILSVATGSAIGLGHEHLSALGLGAILHDMGKVGVPPEILNRSGSLSESEWAQIRRHPTEGATVILSSWDKISPLAAVIAYEHHIHVDGTGYPEAKPYRQPGLLSKIVSIADTYDAITSRRSYRRAEQRQRAIDVLLSGAGTHYDPRVVKVFVKMLGMYPPGSVLELSDGSMAVVIRNNPGALDKPVVKRVKLPDGSPGSEDEVDISSNTLGLTVLRGVDQDRAGVDPNETVQL